ncbi:MAG: hypothetical protein LC796_05925 [Acidobacteria bacterium]|nr:hypothetical protein [Acidobacteriota bacterium]MCA1611741.1 hypothetical protein [Acidobacteriota bacterium]
MWASRLSLRELLDVLRRDSGPPLFYLLEKPVVRLAEAFAWPDTAARLPSWIAALLLGACAFSFPRGPSRRTFAILCAAAPLFLLYGAEARAYALLALLHLFVFLLLLRGAQTPARVALGGAAAAAALWTHSLAILFLGAVFAAAVARRRWRSAAALSAAGVLFSPWIPVLLAQPRAATAWIREPALLSASKFLSALGGSGRLPPNFGVALPAALVAAGAVVAVAATFFTLRSADPDARAAAAVALLTLGAVTVLSLFRPAAFAGRTEMAVLGVWLWGVAAAAGSGRAARACARAIIAVGAVSAALVLASPLPRSLPGETVAAVASKIAPGDALVAGAGFYLPARLAADRGRLPSAVEAYPAEIALHPGWFVPRAPADADVAALERSLLASSPGRRTYLLLHPYQESPALARMLAAHGTARVVTRLPEASLILFVKTETEN